MVLNAGDEPVDVVDEHDQVLRVVTRREMRARRLLHRATSIAVFGTDGRLLVHRRADGKDIWPGRWDLAAGGVVAAGETYAESAVRELAEELGVTLAAHQLIELGSGRYTDEVTDGMLRCYQCTHDGPFTFTDGEVSEVRWVSQAELHQLLATEPFVGDNPAVLLPLLRWP